MCCAPCHGSPRRHFNHATTQSRWGQRSSRHGHGAVWRKYMRDHSACRGGLGRRCISRRMRNGQKRLWGRRETGTGLEKGRIEDNVCEYVLVWNAGERWPWNVVERERRYFSFSSLLFFFYTSAHTLLSASLSFAPAPPLSQQSFISPRSPSKFKPFAISFTPLPPRLPPWKLVPLLQLLTPLVYPSPHPLYTLRPLAYPCKQVCVCYSPLLRALWWWDYINACGNGHTFVIVYCSDEAPPVDGHLVLSFFTRGLVVHPPLQHCWSSHCFSSCCG